MTISINDTERLVIARSGMQNTVQYQVKETNGWETKLRKAFDGNWKGDIKGEMVKAWERAK
jgi:beta-lactamase class A